MFNFNRHTSSGSDWITAELPLGAKLHVRLAHEDNAVTVDIGNTSESRKVSLTVSRSGLGFALGGAVDLEDGEEKPLRASLHLGPVTLYFSARGRYGWHHYPDPLPGAVPDPTGYIPRPPPIEVEPPGLLRRAVRALVGKRQHRRLGVSLDYFDAGTIEGPELRLRACLWDDDNRYTTGRSRQYSASLTHAAWGKPQQSEDQAVEERDVVVAFPEGNFPLRARLMEREIRWPRWPLVKRYRWVEFSPACMLVPRKHSDSPAYEGSRPGCVAAVTGSSFSESIGELVRRVMRDREVYGGRHWGPSPTPHRRESHRVAITWKDSSLGWERLAFETDLFHREVVPLAVDARGQIERAATPTTARLILCRQSVHGGVLIPAVAGGPVLVDGHPVDRPTMLWPESTLTISGHEYTVHYSPIGPVPEAVQLDLGVTREDSLVADVAEVAAGLDMTPPSASEVETLPAAADAVWPDPS